MISTRSRLRAKMIDCTSRVRKWRANRTASFTEDRRMPSSAFTTGGL